MDRCQQDRRQEQELIAVLLEKNAALAAFFRYEMGTIWYKTLLVSG